MNIQTINHKYRQGVNCRNVMELPGPERVRSLGVIELPPDNVRRWTPRRKAAVVRAVNVGEVAREEICRRYQISLEEFLSWQRDYETHGEHGLRSTRLQIYRRPLRRPKRPARRPGAPRHPRSV